MRSIVKNIIYFCWDYLTFRKGVRTKINDVEILFPPRWHKYFEVDYEKENIDFLKRTVRPGMTVIDIGAHLGLVSTIAGKIVGSSGRVYAFEPTQFTFKILSRVMKINKLMTTVRCINKVVSNINGNVEFFIDENKGSNSNSMVTRADKKRMKVSCASVTLDSFIAEERIAQLDFLKIDVEGAELSVLEGGLNVFKQFKPNVVLAIHPVLIQNNGSTLIELYSFIKSINYLIYYNGQELGANEFKSFKDFFDVHLISVKKK